jgi:hypothetical protein
MIKKITPNIIQFFSLLYIFGFLSHGFTSIKYIGLYGAILFFVIDLFLNKEYFTSNIKNIYQKNRLLLQSFIIFITMILISCIFPYSDNKLSLDEFQKEFLNSFIILLLSSIYIKNRLYLLYTILIASIILILKFGYEYYLISHLNFSIRLERNFANYFEFVYPFFLVSFFYIKNIYLRIVISIAVIIGIFELILTGARGSWGAIFIETFIIYLFLFIYNKNIRKKLIYLYIFSISIFLILGVYLFNNSSLIQNKLNKGLNSSGRDLIIKDRLPIFLEHQNYLIGVGGISNSQYAQFLNDYNAPKRFGNEENGKFKYWSDEPFIFQLFYKYGILGLLTFSIFSLIFIFSIFKIANKNRNYLLFGLISSFIGYYFIRALFELRDFQHLVIFLAIFLILQKEKDEDSIRLS